MPVSGETSSTVPNEEAHALKQASKMKTLRGRERAHFAKNNSWTHKYSKRTWHTGATSERSQEPLIHLGPALWRFHRKGAREEHQDLGRPPTDR